MFSNIKFFIFNKGIDSAVNYIFSKNRSSRGYVCLLATHGFSLSLINKEFEKVLTESRLVLPDGQPVSLYSSINNSTKSFRVRGIDFMEKILLKFNSNKKLNRVFFLGGKPELESKIIKVISLKYPNVNIVGFDTRIINLDHNNTDLIKKINLMKPDVVFVGLGCPKQELWMYRNYKKINSILIGIGAAFDFFSGSKKQAPKFFQTIYLEWLFRLFQEPRRLFFRYIIYNSLFLLHFFFFILRFIKNRILSFKF